MLTIFPQLLFLTPLAIALLRVVAGLTIMYAGYGLSTKSTQLENVRMPIIGHPRGWMLMFGAFASFGIGIFILLGLYTQIAAIVGAVAAAKYGFLYWYSGKSQDMPLSAGTSVLLFAICLALVCTGAGIFAFDLPL